MPFQLPCGPMVCLTRPSAPLTKVFAIYSDARHAGFGLGSVYVTTSLIASALHRHGLAWKRDIGTYLVLLAQGPAPPGQRPSVNSFYPYGVPSTATSFWTILHGIDMHGLVFRYIHRLLAHPLRSHLSRSDQILFPRLGVASLSRTRITGCARR